MRATPLPRPATRLALLALAAALAPAFAAPAAAAPAVVADIAPAHGLVARVMQGVAEPTLLIPPGVDEHDYALRPSEAAALEAADLVVWIGEDLTPWLARPLSTLARDARTLALMEAPGVTILPIREGGTWEPHDHGAGTDAAHGHGDAHDHDHGHDHAHDHDHDHGHNHDADHAEAHHHDGGDPHVWLDPENAKRFLSVIADALSEIDPPNAAAYAANAAAGRAEIAAAAAEAEAALAPVRGRPFIVFHDAYQYFETRFAMPAAGSIALNDGSAPGAARLGALHEKIAALDAACVFREPQFEPKLVATVTEGSAARTGVLDPIGADIPPGPGHFPQLIRTLATSLADCLGGAS